MDAKKKMLIAFGILSERVLMCIQNVDNYYEDRGKGKGTEEKERGQKQRD